MEAELVNSLWLAITPLEAQETLLALKIASFTKMKESDRKDFHKKIYRAAYPKENKRKMSLDELEARLKNG